MNEKQYVVFTLDNEEYAIDIVKVYEINRLIEFRIFEFPKVPKYIEGIINLRGEVVPIVNIRKKINIQCESLEKGSRILIVNIKGKLIGILVDSVSEVIHLNNSEICEPCEEMKNKYDFITSIGRKDNRVIFILDLQKVLNVE